MSDRINQIKKEILGHIGKPHTPRPLPERKTPPQEGETFTLKEMRGAYEKWLNGEELTDKEAGLAMARALATRASMGLFEEP